MLMTARSLGELRSRMWVGQDIRRTPNGDERRGSAGSSRRPESPRLSTCFPGARSRAMKNRSSASRGTSESSGCSPCWLEREEQKEQDVSDSMEFDLEGCLAALDTEWGKLPEAALQWAQTHHEQIIPGLIRLVEEATAKAIAGEVPDTNGHFFAFCLLTEFQAKEAWPALLAAMRLPGELPGDLFGDLIHDHWKTAIRMLAYDRVDDVFALIRDPEVYEYVRWSAVAGLVQMVAWELRTREEVIGWLRSLFQEACVAGDQTLAAGIVCEACDLWPGELMEEFRSAFDRNLVDDSIIDWEGVERHHAEGLEAAMNELIERRLDLTDTVDDSLL